MNEITIDLYLGNSITDNAQSTEIYDLTEIGEIIHLEISNKDVLYISKNPKWKRE